MPNQPTDEDFGHGYSVSKNGTITLLRPLSPDSLSDLFDRHPNQLAALQIQQIKLEMEAPAKPAPPLPPIPNFKRLHFPRRLV